MSELLSVDEALEILDGGKVPILETESINRADSLGRILSEPVNAAIDDPAFDNSAMDGYACLGQDLSDGKRVFDIEGIIRPEDQNPIPVRPGCASYITTGSRVPGIGLKIIPVELTEKQEDGRIKILSLPTRNAIRKRGEGYQSGDTLLSPGHQVGASDIGLLQLNERESLTVQKKMRVSIQATGNELTDRTNTNTPILAALLHDNPYVDVECLPVTGDSQAEMESRFQALIEKSDIVITTGGISAGAFDWVMPSMASLGTEYFIRKVNQKPGKPFTYGRCGPVDIFNLPGNPVSALFCMVIYVQRRIRQRAGFAPLQFSALLQNPYEAKGSRTEFTPGFWSHRDGEYIVTTETSIQSHLIHRMSGKNCFVRIDGGSEKQQGEKVSIFPF